MILKEFLTLIVNIQIWGLRPKLTSAALCTMQGMTQINVSDDFFF